MRGAARAAGLALVLACAGGCAAVPTGPVAAPEIYPDRTTPAAAWTTYAWAWRTGDVPTLEKTTGGVARMKLAREVEANGPERTSSWYAQPDLRIDDAEWLDEGEASARLRVVVGSQRVPRTELVFFLARRPDGWVVFNSELIR